MGFMAPLNLTSRDRVNRMFERRDQDRIPRHDHYWPETIARWQVEGLDGEGQAARDRLGGDLWSLCSIWPRPLAGPERVIEEDDQTVVRVDGFGQMNRWWKHKSGTPEHLGWACDSRATWDRQFKPALEQADLGFDLDDLREHAGEGQRRGKWRHVVTAETFEQTRRLIGDEAILMAMIEDPEWVLDMSRTHTDVVLRQLRQVIDVSVVPDGLWVWGDMAYNHATLCSPAMYRELIWPDHKRLVGFAHAHDMKVIYHTDGDVNGVLDLYVEAGFDCLQPMEAKANMDLRTLCPRWGDRLATMGNIDARVLSTNDRDAIEAEVKAKLTAGMATRGYAYHSDHSVPPDVSWETYLFVIDLLDRYGQYA